jgi:hypothetical protein
MIEEGDQGEPFKERIKAICGNEGWMRRLEEEWTRQPEVDGGFYIDNENEDGDEE